MKQDMRNFRSLYADHDFWRCGLSWRKSESSYRFVKNERCSSGRLFGGPKTNMGSVEDTRRSVEALKRRILDMREQVSRGDYRIGASPLAGCSLCGLQEICRSSFSVNG